MCVCECVVRACTGSCARGTQARWEGRGGSRLDAVGKRLQSSVLIV